MTEVILDSNILFSGFGRSESVPGTVLVAVRNGLYPPLFSIPLLTEYRTVLTGQAAMAWHGQPERSVLTLIDSLRNLGRVVATNVGPDCPDPRDQHLWDLLATAPEAILITGEHDLVRSAHFPGRVLSPREFVERHLQGS